MLTYLQNNPLLACDRLSLYCLGQVMIAGWLNVRSVVNYSGCESWFPRWKVHKGASERRTNPLCAWNVLLWVNTGSSAIGAHLQGVKRLLSGLQQNVNAGIGWQQPYIQPSQTEVRVEVWVHCDGNVVSGVYWGASYWSSSVWIQPICCSSWYQTSSSLCVLHIYLR